jgi:hypothetical protein
MGRRGGARSRSAATRPEAASGRAGGSAVGVSRGALLLGGVEVRAGGAEDGAGPFGEPVGVVRGHPSSARTPATEDP